MRKLRLFTPGPVMVPEEVMVRMAAPMEHHRTAAFREIYKDVTEKLEYLYQTQGTCLSIAGSGTAAAEAAIVSCLPKGHKALVVRNGKFAERWAEVCAAFEIPHTNYDVEWGRGADPAKIDQMMAADSALDTVIVVHSETSTAAVSDVKAIGEVVRKRGGIFIIDGITSIGAIPMKMDEWKIDAAITGSQKAMMLPPGLAFVAVNDRAWQRIDSGSSHTYYNNLKKYRKSLEGQESPFTPAISLMVGAQYTLGLIQRIGLENIWKHTRLLAAAMRAASKAIGLKVFAADPVDSVTAMLVPDGVDEAKLRKTMRETHGMQIAGGQGSLKGKIIRVSHMGYIDQADTLGVIGALELTLHGLGHKFELGAGLAAAQRVFAEGVA